MSAQEYYQQGAAPPHGYAPQGQPQYPQPVSAIRETSAMSEALRAFIHLLTGLLVLWRPSSTARLLPPPSTDAISTATSAS